MTTHEYFLGIEFRSSFNEYMGASWLEVHFRTFVLALHCYSGDKINTDFFQITCFKESKIMAVEKNSRITINFCDDDDDDDDDDDKLFLWYGWPTKGV